MKKTIEEVNLAGFAITSAAAGQPINIQVKDSVTSDSPLFYGYAEQIANILAPKLGHPFFRSQVNYYLVLIHPDNTADVYWDDFKDYVSFGPSAHEFINGERAWNVSSLEEYSKAIRAGNLPIINHERLTMAERRTEVLYLQLRSTGVRLHEFMEAFGEDLVLNKDVHAFIEEGWMVVNDGILKLRANGFRFCDAIVTRLMSTNDRAATRIEIANVIP